METRGIARQLVLAASSLVLLAAACSGGDDIAGSGGTSGAATGMGPGISIAEARRSTLAGPLLVNGYLVASSGETRLCEALAESSPPQCAGASLVVRGLELASVEGTRSASGVTWTERPVQLLGEVRDGVLTVARDASG